MPSQYAHYRFGKENFSHLPPEAKQCVQRFRRLYEMGHQGPDILFYYNPFWDNGVNALGEQYHKLSGQEFFTKACAQATTEAARAYLFGLLGHYCLDSNCHPLVNRIHGSGEGSHVEMEKEYDRFLMEQDGIREPHLYDLGERIRLTRGECVTVSGFYPPATPGNIHHSVRFMRFALGFLAKKREKHEKLLKRIKPGLWEHAIPEEKIEKYIRVNSELIVRTRWAAEKYPDMVRQLMDHMHTGAPLGEDFEKPFG